MTSHKQGSDGIFDPLLLIPGPTHLAASALSRQRRTEPFHPEHTFIEK